MNKHLNKLNLDVSELETQVTWFWLTEYHRHVHIQKTEILMFCDSLQFADGVYLVLLMGLLEGYFVPLYNFFLIPENFDHKVNYCDTVVNDYKIKIGIQYKLLLTSVLRHNTE